MGAVSWSDSERDDRAVANDYSRQWFEVFLETVPSEGTAKEVEGVRARLPLPDFRRVLDVCCGSGRHAEGLVATGYQVTGADRDSEAIQQARTRVPRADFVELDQRDLRRLPGPFDAAIILWQSFGFFDSSGNDQVLADIAQLLRPGGRLLLDLFHPGFFAAHQGRTTSVRDSRCLAITNTLDACRLTSTIEYADGTQESMDWELFTPDEISARAAPFGFREIETSAWWNQAREPSPTEQRFQVVLEKV